MMTRSTAATRIICFGDSITEGGEFPHQDRWPTLLQMHLDFLYPDAFEVLNRGIGGNTSAQGFDRLATDVLPYLPGVLLVQFGFNDANVRDWARVPRVSVEEFRKNLREFHRLALKHGQHCVFIVNHMIGDVSGIQGNGQSYRDNFAPYNITIRELAARLNAPYIDLPSAMSARSVDMDQFLAPDMLHLSRAGNRLYAEMVLEGLQMSIMPGGMKARASTGV